jgi:shikimate dehydrogenase
VLGAGGASRAIVHALKVRGFDDIRLLNRTVERAEELVRAFGSKTSAHPLNAVNALAGDAGLVVNTTSLGMHGADALPIDVERLPDTALVTDIVYVPLETPLLAAARKRGLKVVDGLGMLLHQATPGFERWFDRKPEVTEDLHAAIVADIEART